MLTFAQKPQFDQRTDGLRADEALLQYSQEGQGYLDSIKNSCPGIVLGKAISAKDIDRSTSSDTLGALRTREGGKLYRCMKEAVLRWESGYRNQSVSPNGGTEFNCASTAAGPVETELRGLLGCDGRPR